MLEIKIIATRTVLLAAILFALIIIIFFYLLLHRTTFIMPLFESEIIKLYLQHTVDATWYKLRRDQRTIDT